MSQANRINELEVAFKRLRRRMERAYPSLPDGHNEKHFRPKVVWMWQLNRMQFIIDRAFIEACRYDKKRHSFKEGLQDFLGIAHLPRHRECLNAILYFATIVEELERAFSASRKARQSEFDPYDLMHSLRDRFALFLAKNS